jgi:hypothetical protein
MDVITRARVERAQSFRAGSAASPSGVARSGVQIKKAQCARNSGGPSAGGARVRGRGLSSSLEGASRITGMNGAVLARNAGAGSRVASLQDLGIAARSAEETRSQHPLARIRVSGGETRALLLQQQLARTRPVA